MTEQKENKLVMFTTPSCGGCAVLKPLIKAKGLDIEIVDATEQQERADKHEVSTVPLFVYEDENGEHVSVVATGAIEGMKLISEMN